LQQTAAAWSVAGMARRLTNGAERLGRARGQIQVEGAVEAPAVRADQRPQPLRHGRHGGDRIDPPLDRQREAGRRPGDPFRVRTHV
jgi:hypothetical protein